MSVHPENTSDSVDLFRAKKARFGKVGTLPKLGIAPTQKPCLEASYKVAYRIAKTNVATHNWTDFSKAMCPGHGRAGLWIGAEEEN